MNIRDLEYLVALAEHRHFRARQIPATSVSLRLAVKSVSWKTNWA